MMSRAQLRIFDIDLILVRICYALSPLVRLALVTGVAWWCLSCRAWTRGVTR